MTEFTLSMSTNLAYIEVSDIGCSFKPLFSLFLDLKLGAVHKRVYVYLWHGRHFIKCFWMDIPSYSFLYSFLRVRLLHPLMCRWSKEPSIHLYQLLIKGLRYLRQYGYITHCV